VLKVSAVLRGTLLSRLQATNTTDSVILPSITVCKSPSVPLLPALAFAEDLLRRGAGLFPRLFSRLCQALLGLLLRASHAVIRLSRQLSLALAQLLCRTLRTLPPG
jgi:hypothetical protein